MVDQADNISGTLSETPSESGNTPEPLVHFAIEINAFAIKIGIKLTEEPELLYLAREGVREPLPDGWNCATSTQPVYYYNKDTGETSWEHPNVEIYKTKVVTERFRLASVED